MPQRNYLNGTTIQFLSSLFKGTAVGIILNIFSGDDGAEETHGWLLHSTATSV
jgi:hypothetical protein